MYDGSGFRHEEPALVARAFLKDVNGFESHLFETGLIEGWRFVPGRRKRLVEVLAVDITVKPLGHVGCGEDTEGLLLWVRRLKSCSVVKDLVAGLGEFFVVVLALICLSTERRWIELLGSTTEDDVDWDISPRVVLDTVEVSVDDGLVSTTVAGVGQESSGGSIRNVRSRDDTNVATRETVEYLGDGLDFGVIEGILTGIGIHIQAIHGTLVSSVECRSRVGRVGDETVD